MARLKVTQIFFYKCFNLCVTFSSMIYFELIYIIWDMRYVMRYEICLRFIYLWQCPIKWLFFVHCIAFVPSSETSWLLMWVSSWVVYSVLLIFVSILLLTSNCLDQRIFKVSLSIGQCTFCNLSFVFRIFLAIILLCLAV